MRILDISFSENQILEVDTDPKGISFPVKMPRLGKFVVLAGANGAGKSRLLSLIDSILGKYRESSDPTALHRSITQYLGYVDNEQVALQNLKSASSEPLAENVVAQIAAHMRSVESFQNNVAQFKRQLKAWDVITLEPKYIAEKPVFFVPENTELQSVKSFTMAQIETHAKQCASVNSGSTRQSVPSYLFQVMRRTRNARFAELKREAVDEDMAAIEAGDALIKLVTSLLGEASRLTITRDDELQLFGRSDFYTTLSHGQRVLLKLAVQLHAQKVVLSDALILLDEPENHLHPAALSQVIDVLLNEVSSGQVWIATHSIPLISRLVAKDPMCLWFMENGKVSHAGRRPEKVLEGLIGDDTEISMLREFTDLPAKLASNRFAAECLLAPTTVSPKTGDKQQLQMVDALKKNADGKPLRVLDFGAGQGRLLASLREEDLLSHVDYFAFDLQGDSNSACKMEIEKSYGANQAQSRFFTSITDVLHHQGSVDVVVMCNVLHEIPPSDWIEVLGAQSRLVELLSPNGKLLIVEDQRIPIGENAHNHGFMVLDTLQLRKLFKFDSDVSSDDYIRADAEAGSPLKKDRLIAHQVSRKLLLNLTRDTQLAAIIDLYKYSSEKMREIRSRTSDRKPSHQDGQLHAFWMTQYANAASWLSEQGAITFAE